MVQAIREMKARGLRVTFYPFLLMDVPPGNTLPNPYSANAATPGQPASPGAGVSPLPAAASQEPPTRLPQRRRRSQASSARPHRRSLVSATASTGPALGRLEPAPDDPALRPSLRGGGVVDAFLVGTEMRGLTTIRSSASAYPAVTAFKALAADVKAILGRAQRGLRLRLVGYFGHQPRMARETSISTSTRSGRMPTSISSASTTTCASDWRDGSNTLMPLRLARDL